MTTILPVSAETIARAAALIRSGEPVAVPTETVYGLAADATAGEAVARIYEAKGRPSFNPLIIHLASLDEARSVGMFGPLAERLARAFWPGPLTLVVPQASTSPVAALATAGLGTIAVRVPAHPAMRQLIEAVGRPLAAPSANASGAISPTSAAHVAKSLGGRIPLILDGGTTEAGLESTIIGVADDRLRLLRPGPITVAQIEAAAAARVDVAADGAIEAPGQLASHYAPSKPLRLDATAPEFDEWMIGFGAVRGDTNLSARGDLVEAAARLFAALHEADESDSRGIAVAAIPQVGLGAAINDRLRRAAAPR